MTTLAMIYAALSLWLAAFALKQSRDYRSEANEYITRHQDRVDGRITEVSMRVADSMTRQQVRNMISAYATNLRDPLRELEDLRDNINGILEDEQRRTDEFNAALDAGQDPTDDHEENSDGAT